MSCIQGIFVSDFLSFDIPEHLLARCAGIEFNDIKEKLHCRQKKGKNNGKG
jgi:hypothetical protein